MLKEQKYQERLGFFLIFKDIDEVKKHLRLGIPLPCYFITGSDDKRKRAVLKKITEITVGKNSSSDVHRFSSGASADEIADACFEITFGGGRSCVVAEDIALSSGGENEYKKFEQLVEDLVATPDSAVLIFVYYTVDTEPKKGSKKEDGKENRFAKFKKLIDKCGGGIINIASLSPAELASMLEKTALKNHCTLDRTLANYIVQRCGSDSAMLENELRKVTDYRGSGIITKEDIDLMICPTPDAKIYDLANEILFRNRVKAYSVLDDLREQGEEPSTVISALSSAYLDMVRAKSARNSGKTKADIVKDYPRNYASRQFVVDKAMNNQSKYSEKSLTECLDILLSAEKKIRNGASGDTVLDETVARLFAVK